MDSGNRASEHDKINVTNEPKDEQIRDNKRLKNEFERGQKIRKRGNTLIDDRQKMGK